MLGPHALHLLRGRGVPLVRQNEASECGLACLAMLAGAHGHRMDLRALRERHPVGARGSTFEDLLRVGEALHLAGRAVRVELHDLDRLVLPCVLHWDMDHFVVLTAVGRDTVTLHDPARGVRRLRRHELSDHVTGAALEFRPAPGFVPRDDRTAVSLRALLGRVRGLGSSLALLLVLAFVLESLLVLPPLLLQWVVDGALVSGDADLVTTIGLGLVVLVLLQVLTATVRAWAVLALSSSLNLHWLQSVFSHLMRLPLAWFEARLAGDVWSRFNAVQQIQRTLTTQFVEAVLDGVMVVLALAMMALYSLPLAAIALAAVALYAALRAVAFGPLRAAAEEALVSEGRQASHFLESLRGMQAIRLAGARLRRQTAFSALVADTLNAEIAGRKLEIGFDSVHRLVFGLERAAVVWLGALLVLDGRFSVGMLLAFLAWKEQFAARTSGLIDRLVELRMLRLQGERLADIVLTRPEQDDDGAAPARGGAGAPIVEFAAVRFRYPGAAHEVIAGVDLVIHENESVALVGPSGCGKSTLVRLLLGLHVPTAGEVRIDGRPLAGAALAAWRARVGAVMQDDVLFAGTIADNIAFFDPQADAAWVEACARTACIHDDIAALPMAYRTLVGESGSALSGGQRQRVLLARALYRRPDVLVLDEATSALDVDTERALNAQLKALALTKIVVAHRPETIASAARVVALEAGRVAHDLRTVPGPAAPANAAAPRS
jgi:ATP-binding cassette subfamily B protein RaxB